MAKITIEELYRGEKYDIMSAVKDGRIPSSPRSHERGKWDRNESFTGLASNIKEQQPSNWLLLLLK